MPTTSSAWIHGISCSPPATGPPTPALKNGSILPSAPPLLVEHDAGAHAARRARPSSSARLRLALPGDADAGEEVVARRGVLGQRLVAVRAVVADGRGADQHRRARLGRARGPRRGCGCPCSRESRIRRLASSLQRWATFSPARCTTASRPASASAGAGPARRGPTRRPRRRRAPRARGSGSRLSTVTSSPRLGQLAHQPRADQARRPRQRHPHHAVATAAAAAGSRPRGACSASSGGVADLAARRPRRRPGAWPGRRPRRRPSRRRRG